MLSSTQEQVLSTLHLLLRHPQTFKIKGLEPCKMRGDPQPGSFSAAALAWMLNGSVIRDRMSAGEGND